MADILHDAIHVCRKARTCDQCLRLIQVGQRYRKQVHTYDGFTTYRAHEDCDACASELTAIAGSALNSDECIMLCNDLDDRGDRPFITDKYPYVAARLWPPEKRSAAA